jgi:CHAT domain-containing protein
MLEGISPGRRKKFLMSVPDLLGRQMQARLVTLRACSSGVQRMRNAGDEFEGLARAFLLSGVRAVLVSLWNVDQRSSRDFLARFYDELASPDRIVDLSEALAVAQRSFIEHSDPVLQHPYHWAPYVLVGDWR